MDAERLGHLDPTHAAHDPAQLIDAMAPNPTVGAAGILVKSPESTVAAVQRQVR